MSLKSESLHSYDSTDRVISESWKSEKPTKTWFDSVRNGGQGRLLRGRRRLQNSRPCIYDTTIIDFVAWHGEEGPRRSADIDRYLAAESVRNSRQCRVLILGESGSKNALWKQLNLSPHPLCEMDQKALKKEVQRQITGLAKETVDMLRQYAPPSGPWAQEMQILLEMDEPTECAERIVAMCKDPSFHLEFASGGFSWADAESVMLQYTSFNCCQESCSIIEQLERVFAHDYAPNKHDYLHFDTRKSIGCLQEAQWKRSAHDFSFIDIKGSHGRRKAIQYAQDCQCVVFVADMALYDEYHEQKHPDTNRLQEMLAVFESVARSRWLQKLPLLLVLSNAARFRGKLGASPLKQMFRQFAGETADEAESFVMRLFTEASSGRDELYTLKADVLDDENVDRIVGFLEETVLKHGKGGVEGVATCK